MHVRPMQPSDYRETSSVGAAAFMNDIRFGYTNPHAAKYPEHFRRNFLRRLSANLQRPGIHAFVCVSDERDSAWLPADLQAKSDSTDGGEVILAYSVWMRVGPSSDPTVQAWRQNHTDLTTKLSHWLQGWEGTYVDLFRLDYSIDLAAERRVRAYYGQTDHFKDVPSYWRLRALATHPSARRRGIGKKLMKWGMDNALEEDVPAVLSASPDGAFLYRSLGFQTVKWSFFDTSGKAEAHEVMVFDPQRKTVRDVEPGSAEAMCPSPFDPQTTFPVEVAWR